MGEAQTGIGAPETTKPPQIDFYYTDHSKSAAGKIIEVIKTHDIVLMEGMGQTEEDRKILEAQIAFVTNNPDSAEAREFQEWLKSSDNDIFLNIANSCIKNKKEFHIVDASWESQADESSFKAGLMLNNCQISLELGEISEAFREYKDFLVLEAIADRDRERAVAEQVANLEQQNKDKWSGKSVLVVQGAIHTQTHREYVKRTGNSNAKRIMYKPLVVYPQQMRITRSLNYDPEKYINEYEYKKAFIQSFLVSPSVVEATGLNDRAVTIINTITSKISNEEVDRIWNELEDVQKSEDDNKLKGIGKIGKDLVKKYS